MIGVAEEGKPSDDSEIPVDILFSLFGHREKTLRTIAVCVMLFVAVNNGLMYVMTRKMKDTHFSLLQFWFGAIGLALFFAFYIIYSLFVD